MASLRTNASGEVLTVKTSRQRRLLETLIAGRVAALVIVLGLRLTRLPSAVLPLRLRHRRARPRGSWTMPGGRPTAFARYATELGISSVLSNP